jgi:hypothetical protein
MKKTNMILALAVVLTTISTSCKKSDSTTPDVPLPPIGGYNNSDEVGAANLKAYWPLNGNGIESKSSTAPSTTVGTTWQTGAKGQAANLTAGYMMYPSIASLASSLTSFSVSTWVKTVNNGASASVFFSLTRPNEWAGNINFMAETGLPASFNDSIAFKGLIVSSNAIGWQDVLNAIKSNAADIAAGHTPFANKVANTWAQAVLTWDGATRLFKVYSNGVKISNAAWEQRGTVNGDMLTFTTPTTVSIGAFGNVATTTDTWNKGMTGGIDEIRVWNKALSSAEIDALYKLEKAGR